MNYIFFICLSLCLNFLEVFKCQSKYTNFHFSWRLTNETRSKALKKKGYSIKFHVMIALNFNMQWINLTLQSVILKYIRFFFLHFSIIMNWNENHEKHVYTHVNKYKIIKYIRNSNIFYYLCNSLSLSYRHNVPRNGSQTEM